MVWFFVAFLICTFLVMVSIIIDLKNNQLRNKITVKVLDVDVKENGNAKVKVVTNTDTNYININSREMKFYNFSKTESLTLYRINTSITCKLMTKRQLISNKLVSFTIFEIASLTMILIGYLNWVK